MAILLFCTAACSDSYLELSPESSVSDEVIFENADAAQYAVNGLGRIMSTQYLDTQGYNGEGTVYAYQGEYPGDVIQKGSYTGWQNLAKGNYFTSSTNSNIHVTWYYYYKLIRNANQILDNCKTGLANVAEQRKWHRRWSTVPTPTPCSHSCTVEDGQMQTACSAVLYCVPQ